MVATAARDGKAALGEAEEVLFGAGKNREGTAHLFTLSPSHRKAMQQPGFGAHLPDGQRAGHNCERRMEGGL
jgi:hypothetical protein